MAFRRNTRQALRKQAKLDELIERRDGYRAMEKAILEGKPYSYTIGPRTKTNFAMSLSDIRKAIAELDAKIDAVSFGGRRTQAVIPRDI